LTLATILTSGFLLFEMVHARTPLGKWHADHFSEIGRQIAARLRIVICGAMATLILPIRLWLVRQGPAAFKLVNNGEYIMNNLRTTDLAVNDPFESMFRGFLAPVRFDRDADALDIRVDVVEKDDAFKVHADLPGVKKEDINVRIDGNRVHIDAEARREKDVKEKGKVVRSERYYGTVSRVFTLSQDVDEAKAVAKYEDGVLTLELPKKATSSSKKLAIQ
jgi:HSP20 family protein